jgi:hypothetical protein
LAIRANALKITFGKRAGNARGPEERFMDGLPTVYGRFSTVLADRVFNRIKDLSSDGFWAVFKP